MSSILVNKHGDRMVGHALGAAARQAGRHAHSAGIWVVWLRSRQVLGCERVARLDVDPAVSFPEGVNGAVVVAVAPCRVAGSVIGRVDVVYDFLQARGLAVYAVHVPALVAGVVWISLRGTAIAGLVPATPVPSGSSSPRRRLPFAARHRRRWFTAAMAPLAAVAFAFPAAHAAPAGQPGITPTPTPVAGQAGVTAPPAKSVAAVPTVPAPAVIGSDGNGDRASASVDSATSEPVLALQSSARPVSASPSAASIETAGIAVGSDTDAEGVDSSADAVSPPPADGIQVAAVSVPRPQWMSSDAAVQERAWNAFATTTAGAVMAAAGVDSASVGRVLGTEEGESAPVPATLAPVMAILPDAAAAVGALPDAMTGWVAQIVPPLADAAQSVVAQIVQLPLLS